MLARYFGDIYFEEHDNDAYTQRGDIFDMRGVIRVPPSEKIDLLTSAEILIPISTELKQSLISQSYNADDGSDSTAMMESWYGDLFDKDNNLIVKGK